MPRLLISAAHKSSGKTTVSLGLCAALAERGRYVQPFKKGPDYIDPMWLGLAAGRPCYNLDFHTMSPDEILQAIDRHERNADLALIEGNMSLYDGLDLDGSNSNAALARLTRTPIVLVLDATGMTRGIAPLLLGYRDFEADIEIAGVILNQVKGQRHEGKLRAVIEHYTDIPVIGAVHRNPGLVIDERHLGLVPSNEATAARARIREVGHIIAGQVDIDRLLALAGTTPLAAASPAAAGEPGHTPAVRIGIAQDAAFGFYYPDDLEAFARAGATLVPFDTLEDSALPDVDGLFIGGGFPETCMAQLEANTAMRTALRSAIENGMPAYAECGGLMYLARSLSWNGSRHDMVGVIPGDAVMHARPRGRGYVQLAERPAAPWPGAPAGASVAAHEFHYSTLENLPDDLAFAWNVERGSGIDGRHDGIVLHRLLACYSHLRDTGQHHWVPRFVRYVHENRR